MIKWLRENVFYFLSKKKNEEEEAFVQIENYHSMEKIKKKMKTTENESDYDKFSFGQMNFLCFWKQMIQC